MKFKHVVIVFAILEFAVLLTMVVYGLKK